MGLQDRDYYHDALGKQNLKSSATSLHHSKFSVPDFNAEFRRLERRRSLAWIHWLLLAFPWLLALALSLLIYSNKGCFAYVKSFLDASYCSHQAEKSFHCSRPIGDRLQQLI